MRLAATPRSWPFDRRYVIGQARYLGDDAKEDARPKWQHRSGRVRLRTSQLTEDILTHMRALEALWFLRARGRNRSRASSRWQPQSLFQMRSTVPSCRSNPP